MMFNITLKIDNLNAWYGAAQVLRDFSIELRGGEVLCLFGRNGAGKSTALKAIMGLVKRSGSILLDRQQLVAMPAHLIAGCGIGYVPQGRRLFAEMTVLENLEIGLMARRKSAATRARVLQTFAPLQSKLHQQSGTLSGGEQQMLAMARALCVEPEVLLLDEPTEGLMPSMTATIRDIIVQLRAQGVAILLVEQRVEAVLPVAERVAFIENGRVREVVGVQQLSANRALLHKYVGISQ